MSDEFQSAIVDRIDDGQHAVLLVDDAEERVVPADRLTKGASGGNWLQVRFDGDAIAEVNIDQEKQAEMRERISSKLEQLRERGRRKHC